MSEDLDDVLADPARLLTADRSAVRDRIAAAEGSVSVGREVFLQTEAIFGGADVSPAEFASWLHFAAKATGHDEYAEGIAKAEPLRGPGGLRGGRQLAPHTLARCGRRPAGEGPG